MGDYGRFARLVEKVIEHEGGYVCDSADPGGETKYGLCKRTYPGLDIKNLTVEQAKMVYYADWWKPLRCGDIGDDRVAQKLLDTAVNVGPGTGIRLLQQALCDIGRPVAVDGVIGLETLHASNTADPERLLAAMRARQERHYLDLIRRNPALDKFRRGWLARAAS